MNTHLVSNFTRFWLFSSLLGIAAHTKADEIDREIIRQQQWQKQQEEHLNKNADVRLEQVIQTADKYRLDRLRETSCMPVHSIQLQGDTEHIFDFVMPKLVRQTRFVAGMCLGAEGIGLLQSAAQNIVIAKGFVTSSISVRPQNLNDGILVLTIVPGRLSALRFYENNGQKDSIGRIASFPNKFPMKTGGVLNLRDLEQGLENLRRLPTTESNIRIEPSEREGYSDVVVDWSQKKPVAFQIGLDNAERP